MEYVKFYNLNNRFDFVIILISIFSNTLLSVLGLLKGSRAFSAGRVVKLSKINRAFRLFRTCRSIRYLKIFEWGFTTLKNVRNLMFRIILCAPIGIMIYFK